MGFLEFSNRLVRYEDFLNDVAAAVVSLIKTDKDDPEVISQSQAFAMFGRANVERWRREGKIEPCKRPGKVEYRTADLRRLQRIKQDYFNSKHR